MKTISQQQAGQWITESEAQTHEQRRAVSQERLCELVLYVKEHSPYFKETYKNIGENFALEDLPITTKSGLMECYDHWITDPEVTEKSVRTYLANVNNVSGNYLGRYTALSTSGTTGTPMPMVRDSYHNTIHGCLMQQRLLKGIDSQKASPATAKVASIIATDGFVSSYSSALRLKRQLGDKSDNFLILSIMTPLPELIERLNDFCPEMLTGYPSILAILAREKLDGKLTIAPTLIASSAEKMTREVYELLRKAFDCPVLDNYCSTEGGEIAMSCREGHLHLNEDWILLEPVDDNLKPVPPGQWSTGVLMTDLTNYVQPIIRYHVNDCVKLDGKSCICGSNLPVLEISGRMGDTLCLNGTAVAFPVVYFMLADVPNLMSWQIIQTGEHSIEFRFQETYGANRAVVAPAATHKLKESLQTYGCGKVEVSVSEEDFLKSPRGGKTPHIVNRSG
jgi:phenylacetate-coenzyme A ligase PaaK-like adenylate-forming protein